MNITLPLDKMTTAEKLSVMETLWSDLSRDPDTFDSPTWHRDVLQERVSRVAEGQESYQDWETTKKELRERLL